MLTRRILPFCIVFTAIAFYFYFFEHIAWMIWVFGCFLITTIVVFIFRDQINWLWYQRFPPVLPDAIRKMYLHAGAFYRSLNKEDREKFDTRVMLFVESREFIGQGIDPFPEDVKYMIAYDAVMISFHQNDFLFDPYHRIVLYLHPFLTPGIPDRVHTYETEHEDGTIIFSMEQFLAGFIQPAKFIQTGLLAFADLFVRKYLVNQQVPDDPSVWDQLSTVSGWTKQKIEEFTGLPVQHIESIMIHHWFAYPEQMRTHAPELYSRVEEVCMTNCRDKVL